MNKYLNFPHLHGIREATYGLSILQLLLQLPGLDPPSGHGGPHNQKDPAMIQQTSVINLVSQVRVILCHQQNVANLQCLDNVGLPIYLLPLAEVKTSGDSSSLSGSQTNSIIYLLPPVLVHVSSPPDPLLLGLLVHGVPYHSSVLLMTSILGSIKLFGGGQSTLSNTSVLESDLSTLYLTQGNLIKNKSNYVATHEYGPISVVECDSSAELLWAPPLLSILFTVLTNLLDRPGKPVRWVSLRPIVR
jgi:hypothetical protein